MTSFLNPFKRLFNSPHTIPSGMYHYQSPSDDARNYRLHLRLDSTGEGILIVNASTILHLNQSAAEYAYYLVKNTPADQVAHIMSSRYQVQPVKARQDYLDLSARIQTLVESPDLDPVTFLDFERRLPFSSRFVAPYRLDCALTYRLSSQPDSAPVERVSRELTTQEWTAVLAKAWEIGIPHIIFTGGEPTLRDDLPELIQQAENLGQVSGLLTDGMKLIDPQYLEQLLQSGLDHLMIILQPADELSWQAVEKSLVEDLSVTVHLTITESDQAQINAYLSRIKALGVEKISLSVVDASLAAALQSARDQVAALGLELIWNIPVPYSCLHPVALESADALIEGAGRAWLYLEPDGDVLPAQGDPVPLGNFLRDPWKKIWKK